MDFIKDNWAEILTMIGGILTALFGLVIMIIEHNSLTPNKKTFGLLLCVAGGLTASGTYFSSISNNDNQKKLILANKSIDSLTKINTNLSFSNSSKLDLSLNRLESIIDKSNSQIGKLDIVQKDMITNYKKITKETKIIQDKTASLKYLISNNFYLDLQIHFKSKFLSDYIKTYIKNDSFGFVFFKNENYNKSFYYQIVANTLIKNFNKDFVIGIEILEEKRRASDSIVIMRKFIALEAFPNLLANLGTYYRNLDDKLSSFRAFGNFSNNGEVLGLNLQDLPLMLINGGYKTLDELKRAKYKISIYFRKDENFKGECLNVDIEDISIFTLALSHNFDVVLSMQNFNGYKIKDTYFFEPTKINFSNFE